MKYSFVLLTVLCVALGTLVQGSLDYTMVLSQVIHRHGARSPEVDHNVTEICGWEYPCGFLNKEGQQQLVNLGSFLRHRYTEDEDIVDPASPFLTQDTYNLTTTYTRSSNVRRTLQSADALMRGLFPNLSFSFPAVMSETTTNDLLLRSDNLPAIFVDTQFAAEEIRQTCNVVVDGLFPDVATLDAIAEEVHSQGFCANTEKRTSCAKKLCDIGRCYQTTGRLQDPSYPLLRDHLSSLCQVAACINHFKSHYNRSNPVHQMQGSRGQVILQEVVRNMEKSRKGKNTYTVMEYSTHDSALRPLAGSLGDNSDTAMMPPFGTTYVFELLRRSGASSNSTSVEDYAVRVMRGHPGVTPDTNFTFAWDNFQLRCMGASGKEYVAENNVCPLEDFIRYIDSSKPTHAAGLCYIDPVLLQRMNCPVDAALNTGKLSSDCQRYRQQCPLYACKENYRLNAVDYGCYTVAQETGSHSVASGLIISFILGMAVALAGLCMVNYYHKKRSNQYELVPVLEDPVVEGGTTEPV